MFNDNDRMLTFSSIFMLMSYSEPCVGFTMGLCFLPCGIAVYLSGLCIVSILLQSPAIQRDEERHGL
jgi:hypothetical protein